MERKSASSHLIDMDNANAILERLDRLETNHFKHISEDFAAVKSDVEVMKSDLKWIKAIGGFLVIETMGVLVKMFL